MVAPATWRRWPSASTAASSGSAAAPVTSAWMMSPQCSRIERATRAEIAATTCGSSDCRSARDDRPDAGLGVDQVVELGHELLLGADAVVHGLGGHAGRLGDVAHARPGVAVLGEQAPRRAEDLVVRELGPALAQGGGVRRHNLTGVPVTWYTFQLLDTNSSELEPPHDHHQDP